MIQGQTLTTRPARRKILSTPQLDPPTIFAAKCFYIGLGRTQMPPLEEKQKKLDWLNDAIGIPP
jgi:hypothetical protein